MFGTIKINGVDYEMSANAATPIRYRGIFKKDFLGIISNMTEADAVELANVASEMAFIMNMSAKKKDMTALSYDDYVAWMEEIENPIAFIDASPDILDFYTGTMQETSVPKKKAEE